MPRGFSRGGTARRRKEWRPGVINNRTAFTADLTAIAAGINFTDSPTVLRMLFEYTAGPDAAPTAGDACKIGVGIGVVSTDARTVGATAVPDPIGEPEYPWLYWAVHPFFYESATLVNQLGVSVVRETLDIKSMRKIKPRESLVVVVEYLDENGAPPMIIMVGGLRVLVALP